MSKYLLPLVASVLSAAAANAVTVTSPLNGPDQGPLASETYVVDFDTVYADVLTGGAIVSGTSGAAAAPLGDGTNYLVTGTGIAPATIDVSSISTGFRTFSVYIGSIDAGNTITVFDLGGNQIYSITGSALPEDNGNQNSGFTNRRVFFKLGAGETLGSVQFSYDRTAFEVDDVAFGGAVPEPATWAMLVAGFGLVGTSLRRRKPTVVAA